MDWPTPPIWPDWPTPPIWPDDLDDVREPLTDEEWEDLLRRHWTPWPFAHESMKRPKKGGDSPGVV
jgi:hypothetical protein